MSEPGQSPKQAIDSLRLYVDVFFGNTLNDLAKESLVQGIRTYFYVQTHDERNTELARIYSWQQDLKEQVKAEIELENGTYKDVE